MSHLYSIPNAISTVLVPSIGVSGGFQALNSKNSLLMSDMYQNLEGFDWSSFKGWMLGRGYEEVCERCSKLRKKVGHSLFSMNVAEMAKGGEHALKGLACLSDYLGCYDRFTAMKRQSGLKWCSKSSENVFMELFEWKGASDDTEKWMNELNGKLRAVREDVWTTVVFLALSGIRPSEGVLCLNKIRECGLDAYPVNKKVAVLEHFRDKRFLRRTKKCYLTPLTNEMKERLENWHSYMTYKKIKVWVKKVGYVGWTLQVEKMACDCAADKRDPFRICGFT